MKVRCALCKHEKDGFCQKKTKYGQPTRIRLNKPRRCNLYGEDPMRVFADYKKKETHRATLKRQEMRRRQLEAAMKKLVDERAAGFVEEVKDDQST